MHRRNRPRSTFYSRDQHALNSQYSGEDRIKRKRNIADCVNDVGKKEAESSNYVDNTFREELTEEKLQGFCGTRDLRLVTQLELAVDVSQMSLDKIMFLLPSLQRLILDNSLIPSLRDLCTNMNTLRMISMSNVGLQDLDGISVLSGLSELRLSNNRIKDLTPLALHESLQILDLSHNALVDINSFELLGTCTLLYSLDLRGNPIARGAPNYRQIVCYHIPQLRILEGKHVDSNEGSRVTASMLAEANCVLQEQNERGEDSQLQLKQASMSDTKENGYNVPVSHCDNSHVELRSSSSELTHGTFVITGNVAKSLIKRRALDHCLDSSPFEVDESMNIEEDLLVHDLSDSFIDSSQINSDFDCPNTTTHKVKNVLSKTNKARTVLAPHSTFYKPCVLNRCDDYSSIDIMIDTFQRFNVNEQRRSRYYAKTKNSAKVVDFDSGSESDDSSIECDRHKRMAGAFAKMDHNQQVHDSALFSSVDNSVASKSHRSTLVRKALHLSNSASTSDKAGRKLGFNLRSCLENISVWANESGSDNDTSDDEYLGTIKTKKSTTVATPTAHSRDEIMKMCHSSLSMQNDNTNLSVAAATAAATSSPLTKNTTFHNEIIQPKTSKIINPRTRGRGEANDMKDDDIIRLLQKQPKDVLCMKTRESFRAFFTGMKRTRMECLLRVANRHLELSDMDRKVSKRMKLLHDVLT
mmetsp:Transcript_15377/g.22802  ORF Transcript_15377/g.22802 Transcript_15377/m.22802 type:complete len:697 (-) Transcript_15377:87-2177(-)